MAVAFRSKATSPGAGNGTTLTFTKPADWAADDIILAEIYHEDGVASDLFWAAPSGFTYIGEARNGPVCVAMWWKRATGSEPASYTFTPDNSTWRSGSLMAYSGAETTGTPVNTISTDTAGSTRDVELGSGSTSVDGAMLVALVCSFSDTRCSPLAGTTDCTNERADFGAQAVYDGIQATAGSVGQKTYRFVSADDHSGMLIELLPETGGGGTTHQGEAALTATATAAPTGRVAQSAAGALTATATVAPTGRVAAAGTAALTASATVAASGRRAVPGASAHTATATLAATGQASVSATSALTGAATATATGRVAAVAAATPTATGTLAAAGRVAVAGASALAAAATLAADGTVTADVLGTAALTASATLAATGTVAARGAATLTGAVTVGADAVVAVAATAALAASATVAAAGARAVPGAAALTATATLSGTAATGVPIPNPSGDWSSGRAAAWGSGDVGAWGSDKKGSWG